MRNNCHCCCSFFLERTKLMATKEVKAREAAGENLEQCIWVPEKPYLLVRGVTDGNGNKCQAISFFVSRKDFNYAVSKAEKSGYEIMYAAKVEAFQKIMPGVKSGFGRGMEVSSVLYVDEEEE